MRSFGPPLVALVALLGCSSDAKRAEPGAPRVLVFTKCIWFCHDSRPAAVQALQEMGQQAGFSVDATEDAAVFTDARLDAYAAVVFVSTTVENGDQPPFPYSGMTAESEQTRRGGAIMDASQKAAFERYIRKGRGFVGVHAANDGDYRWPFYVEMLGGMFKDHVAVKPVPTARIVVEDTAHPSTASLGASWTRAEEWYNLDVDPRPRVHVLLSLDESSYTDGPKMNGDHPLAWCREYAGSRIFYTALGHEVSSYAEPLMRAHLLGAVRWAARMQDGSCALP